MPEMNDERGFASVTALVVMMVMLAVAGAVFSSSVQLSNSSNTDDAAQRAYQAAVAGVNTAVDRIERNKTTLTPPTCITTVVSPPVAGQSWCAETAQEPLGKNQFFSYRVSVSPPPGGACAGDSLDAGSGDRCVIARGRVNGVERVVAARMGIGGTSTPFANSTSVVGFKDVKLKTGAKVNSNLGVNKTLSLDRDANVTGGVYLGPKGKIRSRNTTVTQINKVTEFFPAPVSFLTVPPTVPSGEDTAVVNRNTTDPTTSGISPLSYYTEAAGKYDRELNVPNGKSVTLSGSGEIDSATGLPKPAYYNFCKVTLGTGSKIVIPSGVWVRFYIDSKDRAGSRCSGVGELAAGKNSSFSNGNKDPRSLQIFAWSKKSKLTIPNKQDIYALIYAPFSKVKFSNIGKLFGGVAAQNVEIRKGMQVNSVAVLDTYNVSTLNSPAITAWKQCRPYLPMDGPSPAAGC